MYEFNHIRFTGESLILLDQRALPFREIFIECKSAADVAESDREMVVRGAPAIGICAAYGVALAARNLQKQKKFDSPTDFLAKLDSEADMLRKSRPTAVNLFWAVERMLKIAAVTRPDRVAEKLADEAARIHGEDIEMNTRIGANGAELLEGGSTVLTHCNAGSLATGGYGTALGVIRSAWKQGKIKRVFSCETRPYLQGARLTVYELTRDGIETVLITDNMAGYMMSRGEINAVIVGADRIAANGDTANKIGTYSLAVLAKENNIPFYVAAPRSTIDPTTKSGAEIIIEERSSSEVTEIFGRRIAPEGIRVRNPAFDVTPAKYITAIITDERVFYPPCDFKRG
ncbi:MAG: S-methyl-5-thioribose-1-phosphate isomerase [Deltaproteobacteria bacterium]|nr:S-methyl-5-thioribose-1-phosphate isomerase [Deltaproteobacteria bacterium]